MPNFDHLKKLEIRPETTAEYKGLNIEGDPVLVCAMAGEPNRDFFNELLRISQQAGARENRRTTVDTIAENRDRDRKLWARYIVRGWRNVREADGSDCPYTPENCLVFLQAIPDDMFGALRAWCQEEKNFRPPATEEVSKN
jgi:hypothetical protein